MSSIDVIVPCYRYGRYLRECVESVLAQTGPAVRALIIDDASPDNTAEVAIRLAREDHRVTFLRHAENKGHIATYNEGIDWASADYLMVLSADDYLLPGALGRAAALMDAHPEIGLTYGEALTLHPNGWMEVDDAGSRGRTSVLSGREFIERSGARNLPPTPTVVVRTGLQKEIGGYRPQLRYSGDMEMWLRFAARADIGVIGAAQAVYRRHESNMSLAYTADTRLPDLEERRAVFDYFFRECGSRLADADRLQARLFRELACMAVSHASAAFNAGRDEDCARIAAFALATSPGVKRSWPWTKLAIKKVVGRRAWGLAEAARDGLRRRPHGHGAWSLAKTPSAPRQEESQS